MIIIFLIIVSFFLRIPNYTKLSVMPDEILYSNYAYSIIAFNWGWPPDQMVAQPPLLPYILVFLTYLYGGSLEIFRLVPIFFGVLDVIAVFFLGKVIYNSRVGAFSALLLAFSSYHIFYSRTLMLETMLIFFILASMYFFWRAYTENKLYYAVLAGVFLGLGDNTKYTAFLLYLILVAYLLWVRRRGLWLGWGSLLEKKFWVILIVSFLVFSPVVIDLFIHDVDPFYWQLFERYKLHFAGYKSASQFGIIGLAIHGFDNYAGMLMDATPQILNGFYIKSGSIATMNLPWLYLFELATYVLLPVTILYYLYFSLKNQPRESFLFIAFLAFNVFVAIFSTRFQYYLLWNAPLFFIMFSNMAVNFANKIKLKDNSKISYLKNFMRIFVVLMAIIFLLSYIYIGTLSPFVNESVKVGYETQIIKIKDTISFNDSIATDKLNMLYYYLDKYDMIYISIIPLYKVEEKNKNMYLKVDLDMLDTIKPKFILVAIYSFSSYATDDDILAIQERYNLVSYESDELLYERKAD